ncbi:MAG TPA: PQQ-dependent sugar dehydrogenase, partial [Flavisolibacter sp.]|nr:PQQ-dependent sugar dehydrogenase [Flavisolibacter sp.]
MFRFPTFITALASIGLASCSANSPKNGVVTNTSDSTNPPVETRSPNTNYSPAFAGQTRIISVKTSTPYEATVITNNLKRPWGITTLPDGRLLITEKEGQMRIATTNGQLSDPITGIPPVASGGQGGLLGVTIDPQFATNRMIYWAFSENVQGGSLTSAAKGMLSADEKRIENATVIYRATPAYNNNMHFGGRILVDNAGHVYLSTGERSDLATRPLAQDLNAALGKI